MLGKLTFWASDCVQNSVIVAVLAGGRFSATCLTCGNTWRFGSLLGACFEHVFNLMLVKLGISSSVSRCVTNCATITDVLWRLWRSILMLVLLSFCGVDDGELCGYCASISDACSTWVHDTSRTKKRVDGIKKRFDPVFCCRDKLTGTVYSRIRIRKK